MTTVEELAGVGNEARTARGRLSSQSRRLRELDLAILSQPQVSRLQTAIQLITAVIDEAEGITQPPPARVAAPCAPVIERDGKRYRLACPGCGLNWVRLF